MKKKGKRGFTLIELMVAIAIIAISLVTLVSVILANIRLDDLTKEMNLAANAINLQVERLRGVPYNVGIRDNLGTGSNPVGEYTENFPVPLLRGYNDPFAAYASTTNPHPNETRGFIHMRSELVPKSAVTNRNDIDYDPLDFAIEDYSDQSCMVRFRVRVDWRGADGKPKFLEMHSMRSDRGQNANN
jgi:prepilin-type N-terminal cleavage/methylation domain-containing protein